MAEPEPEESELDLVTLDVEKPLFFHGPRSALADKSDSSLTHACYSQAFDLVAVAETDSVVSIFEGSKLVQARAESRKGEGEQVGVPTDTPICRLRLGASLRLLCASDPDGAVSGVSLLCVASGSSNLTFYSLEAAAAGREESVYSTTLDGEELAEARWRSNDLLCVGTSGRVFLIEPLQKRSNCVHDVVDFVPYCIGVEDRSEITLIGGAPPEGVETISPIWALDTGASDAWPVVLEGLPSDVEEEVLDSSLRGIRIVCREPGKTMDAICLFVLDADEGPMTILAIFRLSADFKMATLKAFSHNDIFIEEHLDSMIMHSVWVPEWSLLLVGASNSADVALVCCHPSCLEGLEAGWAVLAPPEGRQLVCPNSVAQDCTTSLRGLCLLKSFQGEADRRGGSADAPKLAAPVVVLLAASDGSVSFHFCEHYLERPKQPQKPKAQSLGTGISKGSGPSNATEPASASPFAAPAAQSSGSSPSPFGSSTQPSASPFGAASSGPSASPFGGTTQPSPFSSALGGSSSSAGSLFSGQALSSSPFAPATPSTASSSGVSVGTSSSPFGANAGSSTGTSLFGSSASSPSPFGASATGASLFGSTGASSSGSSLFGSTPASSSGPLGTSSSGTSPFGTSAGSSSSTSLLGSTASSAGTSLFGSTGGSSSGSSLFGSTPASSPGPLGTSSSGTSLFGTSPGSSSSTSLFGSTASSAGSSTGASLFSNAASSGSGGSLFGSSVAKSGASTGGGSLFGSGASSLAGAASGSGSGSLFGSSLLASSPFAVAAAAAGAEGSSAGSTSGTGPAAASGSLFGGIAKAQSSGGILGASQSAGGVEPSVSLSGLFSGLSAGTGGSVLGGLSTATQTPTVAVGVGSGASGSTAMKPATAGAPDKEWCREKIEEVYTKHNPAKLSEIDTLMKKYLGDELTLYKKVCKKYGVEPEQFEGAAPEPAARNAAPSEPADQSNPFGRGLQAIQPKAASPKAAPPRAAAKSPAIAAKAARDEADAAHVEALTAAHTAMHEAEASRSAPAKPAEPSASPGASLFAASSSSQPLGAELFHAPPSSNIPRSDAKSLETSTVTPQSKALPAAPLVPGKPDTPGFMSSAAPPVSVFGASLAEAAPPKTVSTAEAARPKAEAPKPKVPPEVSTSIKTTGGIDIDDLLKDIKRSYVMGNVFDCFQEFEQALRVVEKSNFSLRKDDLTKSLADELKVVTATCADAQKRLSVVDAKDRAGLFSSLAKMQSDVMYHYSHFANQSDDAFKSPKVESLKNRFSKIQTSLASLEDDMIEKFRNRIDWERDDNILSLPESSQTNPQEEAMVLSSPITSTYSIPSRPACKLDLGRRTFRDTFSSPIAGKPPNPLTSKKTTTTRLGSIAQSKAPGVTSSLSSSIEGKERSMLWLCQDKAQKGQARAEELTSKILALSIRAKEVTSSAREGCSTVRTAVPQTAVNVCEGPVHGLRESLFKQLRAYTVSQPRRRASRLALALEVCEAQPSEIDTPTFGSRRGFLGEAPPREPSAGSKLMPGAEDRQKMPPPMGVPLKAKASTSTVSALSESHSGLFGSAESKGFASIFGGSAGAESSAKPQALGEKQVPRAPAAQPDGHGPLLRTPSLGLEPDSLLFSSATTPPGATSKAAPAQPSPAPAPTAAAAAPEETKKAEPSAFGASGGSTSTSFFSAFGSTTPATSGGLFGASTASTIPSLATASTTSPPATVSTPSPTSTASATPGPGGVVDVVQAYKERVLAIYRQHNPSKLAEVDNLMTKYKGQESVLYQKICKKYNVPPEPEIKPTTPPTTAAGTFGAGASQSQSSLFGGGLQGLSSGGGMFGSSPSSGSGMFGSSTTGQSSGGLFGSSTTAPSSGGLFGTSQSSGSGFGMAQSSGGLFGSSQSSGNALGAPQSSGSLFGAAQSSGSAFGAPPSSGGAFGAPQSSGGLFGAPQSGGSAFGSLSAPPSAGFGSAPVSPSPFGQPAQAPSAFGSLGGGGALGQAQPTLGQPGRSPVDECRERITAIYQQHNPTKLSEIGNLLTKYQGKEQELYLKICKKYNVPPQPSQAAPAGLGGGGLGGLGGGGMAGFAGASPSPFGAPAAAASSPSPFGGAPAGQGGNPFGGGLQSFGASPFSASSGGAPTASANPFGGGGAAPSPFGAAAPTFGAPSALGGAPSPFGGAPSPSPFGGAAAGAGGAPSPFGSAASAPAGMGGGSVFGGPQPQGGVGFAALAQGQGGFGSFAAPAAASSPFGGAAAGGGFGGGFGGTVASPFAAGAAGAQWTQHRG